MPVLSHPPEVRDRPAVAHFHRVLKDELVLGHFNRRSWSVCRWRQDLHAGTLSSPRTGYAKTAEAAVAPNLNWSGSFDLLDNLLPLSGIECRTWLDGDDLLAVGEGQFDPAGIPRERKIKRIRIVVAAVILAGPSYALEQNEP